ncbi:MAG: IS5 family transposase [Pigmentiphaga sp.]
MPFENPYWQVFTGETYLQTEPPIDPSSPTRRRKRLGEAGVEELLAATVAAAKRGGLLRAASFKTVIVDTTVAPKAAVHPTDSRLLERSREHLVKAAGQHGIKLRQNYNRKASRLTAQIGRYAHARQVQANEQDVAHVAFARGSRWRDIDRQIGRLQEGTRASLQDLMACTKRILVQRQKHKNKLYALQAPEVEYISKDKAGTPYEFGVKISVATTLKEGFMVGARSMPGNPDDGHTLAKALQQAGITAEHPITTVIVGRGYHGVEVQGVRILRGGQRRGVTRGSKAMIKWRSSIEPAIGHMKADGKLGRNRLNGDRGDALHAVLCGCWSQHSRAAAPTAAFYVWILSALTGTIPSWASESRS